MSDDPRRRVGDAIYGMYQQLQEDNARLLALLRDASDALAPYAPGSKQGQVKARLDALLSKEGKR